MDYKINNDDNLDIVLENQAMILYAIGSFLTDCEIEKAEKRGINKAMMKNIMLSRPNSYLGIKCLYQAVLLGNPGQCIVWKCIVKRQNWAIPMLFTSWDVYQKTKQKELNI